MTDDCDDLTKNSYLVYERIAETSNGQVYRLSKSEVKEVLQYVKVALQPNVVNLLSQHKPATLHNKPDEHEVMIDETLKQFTISVSGKNASIYVTDPKGKNVDGPPQLEPLLTLDNVKIVNVKEPDPGPWKVMINSASDYTVRSTGLSGVKFNHGFSTVETTNLMETNHRPLQGKKLISRVPQGRSLGPMIFLNQQLISALFSKLLLVSLRKLRRLKIRFKKSHAVFAKPRLDFF